VLQRELIVSPKTFNRQAQLQSFPSWAVSNHRCSASAKAGALPLTHIALTKTSLAVISLVDVSKTCEQESDLKICRLALGKRSAENFRLNSHVGRATVCQCFGANKLTHSIYWLRITVTAPAWRCMM
jgi:hypothetical protein